jgi:hypothetical protein
VSFWCAFGGPSRAVRLVSWGRTVLFENSLAPRHNLFATVNATNTQSRRNCLPAQPFTSESSPKKKRLHPTADRQGARHLCFALSRNQSTPRTEKKFHRFCNPHAASSSITPPPSPRRSRPHVTVQQTPAKGSSASSPLKKWKEGVRSKFSVIAVRRKTSSRQNSKGRTSTFRSSGCGR